MKKYVLIIILISVFLYYLVVLIPNIGAIGLIVIFFTNSRLEKNKGGHNSKEISA
jgi:hypothetical protein